MATKIVTVHSFLKDLLKMSVEWVCFDGHHSIEDAGELHLSVLVKNLEEFISISGLKKISQHDKYAYRAELSSKSQVLQINAYPKGLNIFPDSMESQMFSSRYVLKELVYVPDNHVDVAAKLYSMVVHEGLFDTPTRRLFIPYLRDRFGGIPVSKAKNFKCHSQILLPQSG